MTAAPLPSESSTDRVTWYAARAGNSWTGSSSSLSASSPKSQMYSRDVPSLASTDSLVKVTSFFAASVISKVKSAVGSPGSFGLPPTTWRREVPPIGTSGQSSNVGR
ncbi:MAG: hypothetical protein R2702_14225 [Acidimicrobiales bacterium]